MTLDMKRIFKVHEVLYNISLTKQHGMDVWLEDK